MSEVLSMHDHGNCELCDQLESELALLRRAVKQMAPGMDDYYVTLPGVFDPDVLELIKEQEDVGMAEDR